MADNVNKIDRIHDLLPKHFNSKNNTNWKALVEAIGAIDQQLATLIEEVRQQFFVKTASRPYIDRLAANNRISRPKLVGMDDTAFREYIPILSYKPKQVKLIIDQLLDVFFFKESTTAFINTKSFEPFYLENGWELSYIIDENFIENIIFLSTDFQNITAASADEVAAVINRQTKYSYAVSFYDSIAKKSFIKIFSNTIGSKGAIRILGGRACIGLRPNGFIDTAGNGSNTEWTITKIGQTTTFTYTGGSSPGINQLQVGDIIIINLAGNIGSFPIDNIDLAGNAISFNNLFSTAGIFTQSSSNQVKFLRPKKFVVYLNNKRAITWETRAGEIIVEMPTSPPIVKRSLKGSWHINGEFSIMSNRDSDTSLTIEDATNFPKSGSFIIEPVEEMQLRWLTPSEDTLNSYTNNSRLIGKSKKYTYTSRVALATTGDIVAGSNVISNLASVVGLAVGQDIYMDGFPKYTKVDSISGFSVVTTQPSTITANSQPVEFLGNTLIGIDPPLPIASSLNNQTNTSIVRTSNIVTVTTAQPHGYKVGDTVILRDSIGMLSESTTADLTLFSTTLFNIASTTNIAFDDFVFGTGIAANTKVTNIFPNSVEINTQVTVDATNSPVNFYNDINGSYKIISVTSNTYSFEKIGVNGTALAPGVSYVEKVGLANSGSRIILTNAVDSQISRITGNYIWDLKAPYVLSSKGAITSQEIKAGNIVRFLNTIDNTIPNEDGFIIFNYGLNNQEGPIRYLYKPTDNTIAIDPSYIFKKSHPINSKIVTINKRGGIIMSTRANEYAPYVTNPSESRFILQDLIKSVKSAGIFVNFLIRFPEQLYGILDVYDQQGQGFIGPFND